MRNIKLFSKILSLIFILIAVSIPLITVWFEWLLYLGVTKTIWGLSFTAKASYAPQSILQLLVSCCLMLIPRGILVASFCLLARLFQLYAKGLYFTRKNILLYKRAGWSLIFHFFATILIIILQPILFMEGPNYKFDFSPLSFSDILIGSIILCISWVFIEASKIEEENRLTI